MQETRTWWEGRLRKTLKCGQSLCSDSRVPRVSFSYDPSSWMFNFTAYYVSWVSGHKSHLFFAMCFYDFHVRLHCTFSKEGLALLFRVLIFGQGGKRWHSIMFKWSTLLWKQGHWGSLGVRVTKGPKEMAHIVVLQESIRAALNQMVKPEAFFMVLEIGEGSREWSWGGRGMTLSIRQKRECEGPSQSVWILPQRVTAGDASEAREL